jgi:cell division protein FtsB
MDMPKRKTVVIGAISVVVIAVLCVLIFGERGFLDMYSLYRQDTARAREVAAARAEIDSLKSEIEKLKSDTVYIEKIAREKLGMARKGEFIFKFPEGKE